MDESLVLSVFRKKRRGSKYSRGDTIVVDWYPPVIKSKAVCPSLNNCTFFVFEIGASFKMNLKHAKKTILLFMKHDYS